ncbi:MAG: FkbM family methyltransferase, partial [Candidatus Woesebacteria bacterium]|nr:FkbM family methyltransferase [Candidatus Woesebacteria bacterium]
LHARRPDFFELKGTTEMKNGSHDVHYHGRASLEKNPLGSMARSIIASLGLRLTRISMVPVGADLLLDLTRYLPSNRLRTIFDVGANIGQTAVPFAQTFPGATIYSFEPASDTYRVLMENIVKYENIRGINIALGEKEGISKIYHQRSSGWNSLAEQVNKPSEIGTFEEVKITTLSIFCQQNGVDQIDLLKMDAEGYEKNILRGASDLMSSGKISYITSEVGLDSGDERHTNFFELSRMLNDFRFVPVAIYDQKVKPDLLGSSYANALFAYAPK